MIGRCGRSLGPLALLALALLLATQALAAEAELPAAVRNVLAVRDIPDDSLSIMVTDVDGG